MLVYCEKMESKTQIWTAQLGEDLRPRATSLDKAVQQAAAAPSVLCAVTPAAAGFLVAAARERNPEAQQIQLANGHTWKSLSPAEHLLRLAAPAAGDLLEQQRCYLRPQDVPLYQLLLADTPAAKRVTVRNHPIYPLLSVYTEDRQELAWQILADIVDLRWFRYSCDRLCRLYGLKVIRQLDSVDKRTRQAQLFEFLSLETQRTDNPFSELVVSISRDRSRFAAARFYLRWLAAGWQAWGCGFVLDGWDDSFCKTAELRQFIKKHLYRSYE